MFPLQILITFSRMAKTQRGRVYWSVGWQITLTTNAEPKEKKKEGEVKKQQLKCRRKINKIQ